MLKTATVRFKDLSRWDVKSQTVQQIKSKFSLYRMSDLLQQVKNTITIQDNILYTQITVKLYNKGIIARGQQMGSEILTKSQNQVKQGQFIISKIDGKDGAFGIIPSTLHNAIVTNDFPIFDIKNKSLLLMDYFVLFLSYEEARDLLQRTSVGTTGRKRLQIEIFLNLKIPLPPLAEQKRIVALWQAAEAQAQADRQKAEQLRQDIDAYLMAELGITIQKQEKAKIFTARFKDLERWDVKYYKNMIPSQKSWIELGEILQISKNYISIQDHKKYKQLTVKLYHQGISLRGEIIGADILTRPQVEVQGNDFIFSKIDGKDGAFGVVPDKLKGAIVTNDFPVFQIKNSQQYYIEYIDAILSLEPMLNYIKGLSVGTTGRKRTTISELLRIKVPKISVDEQKNIVNQYQKISQLQKGAQDRLDSSREQIKKMILI